MKNEPQPTLHNLPSQKIVAAGKLSLCRHQLDELLYAAGLVDDQSIAKAELLQQKEGLKPVEAFLRLGVMDEYDLVEFLCRRLGLPSTDLAGITVDLIARMAVPELPVSYLAIPWLVEDGIIHVAMANPTDLDPVYKTLSKTGLKVRVYCSVLSDVKRVSSPGTWVPDYKSNAILRKAQRGESDAQFQMGELNYKEAESVGSYETALKWWLMASVSGHGEASFNIARMYDEGVGAPESVETALAWYRRSGEQGYASAQFALGYYFANGLGTTRNYREAVKWYQMAADQGDAAAQNNLGVLYGRGDGVPQDDLRAALLYRAAADQGAKCAQFNLAHAYDAGRGVPKDYSEAMKWFRASAELGDISAQNALADRLMNGWITAKDEGEAVLWYWKAARQGDAYAQYKVGEAFDNGHGVWPDRTLAMKWYREAARQGNQDARQALRRAMRIAIRSDVWASNAHGDWELEHYPVILRSRQRNGPINKPRVLWSAEIMGWSDMSGIGECEEDAYLDLEARFLAFREDGNMLPPPVTDELIR